MSLGSLTSSRGTVKYASAGPPGSPSRNCSSRVKSASYNSVQRVPTFTVMPPNNDAYALPCPKPMHYSAAQMQFESLKQRCRMIEEENKRLMDGQSHIITDANRRVDMHIKEIRMLKEENKKIAAQYKEVRDLCCVLDEDRQRAKRLTREWQKFAKYTSNVMKQEVDAFHQRSIEMDNKSQQIVRENEELRQLCLYLDGQRQSMVQKADDFSDDLGCGGSERSQDSDSGRPGSVQGINEQKEKHLQLISSGMQTSICIDEENKNHGTDHGEDRLEHYVRRLESRIKFLEVANNQNEPTWSGDVSLSDCDDRTVIDNRKMNRYLTDPLTSSGTSYGSSETDGESAVFVINDDCNPVGLEVRTLSKIDENEEKDCARTEGSDDETTMKDCDFDERKEKTERNSVRIQESTDKQESNLLPPQMAPLSASLLSIGRLSLADIDRDHLEMPPISVSASHSPAPPACVPKRASSTEKNFLSDAVKIFRAHEKSDDPIFSTPERVVVRRMCQLAWDNVEHKSDISAV